MTKKLFLALWAFAAVLPLAGCRHSKCCSGPSASYAIPAPCNDCGKPATLPPTSIPVTP
ncbi:MAG: hypothetical protein K2X87_29825 [Gemmataceae bacterium]|nr:hypothetical protein [Gemmataceae bacterium]